MAYVEARQYSNASDMLASAAAIRARLLRPRPKAGFVSEKAVRVQAQDVDIISKYREIVVRVATSTNHFPALDGSARDYVMKRARAMGFTFEAIVGRGSSPLLIAARQQLMGEVYMYFPNLSLPQIGTLFKRDHSTIHHNVVKVGAYGKRGQVAS